MDRWWPATTAIQSNDPFTLCKGWRLRVQCATAVHGRRPSFQARWHSPALIVRDNGQPPELSRDVDARDRS
jgi:hypothetical protein